MKKSYLYLLSAVVFALSMSSCATYRTNYKYATNPIFSLEETNVSNGKLETDLEMVGKISGSASFDSENVSLLLKEGSYVVDENFAFRGKAAAAYEEAKAAALHDAISKAGCDIILAPIYKLTISTTSGSYISKKYSVTVSGFGANIKGIRQIKE